MEDNGREEDSEKVYDKVIFENCNSRIMGCVVFTTDISFKVLGSFRRLIKIWGDLSMWVLVLSK